MNFNGSPLQYSCLENPMDEEPGRLQSMGSLRVADAGRDWGQEEKGTTEDEMAGWHH